MFTLLYGTFELMQGEMGQEIAMFGYFQCYIFDWTKRRGSISLKICSRNIWMTLIGKIPRADSLTSLSQQLGMTVRQVERWFRIRRMQNKPSTLDKFSETGYVINPFNILTYILLYTDLFFMISCTTLKISRPLVHFSNKDQILGGI